MNDKMKMIEVRHKPETRVKSVRGKLNLFYQFQPLRLLVLLHHRLQCSRIQYALFILVEYSVGNTFCSCSYPLLILPDLKSFFTSVDEKVFLLSTLSLSTGRCPSLLLLLYVPTCIVVYCPPKVSHYSSSIMKRSSGESNYPLVYLKLIQSKLYRTCCFLHSSKK